MQDAQLAPPSYVKHALADQHNLILLFGAAAFSLAFATPLPLVIGAAGELLWLIVGPQLPAFRRWVDEHLAAQHQARANGALEATLGKLPAADSSRFLLLSRSAEEVLAFGRERDGLTARELQPAQQGLLDLRRTFLDYQVLSRRVTTLIEATPAAALEEEAGRLQQSYSAERDLSVRMTIRKALTQSQRQLQQQQQLVNLSRTIGLRLEMIEKALAYLKGQVANSGSSRLAPELERVLADVGSAAELEPSIQEAFNGPGPSWAPIR